MKPNELINQGVKILESSGIEDPQISSEEILRFTFGVQNRSELYLIDDVDVSCGERFVEHIKKRSTGYPLQYIVKEVGFLDLTLKVDERVLIPRPETETVVLRALDLFNNDAALNVLDIGTGSGVIALSIAYYLKNTKVTAVDVSNNALSCASENAAHLGFTERVTFIESNLFDAVDDQFDLIISNPPYVRAGEIERLQKELSFEPQNALDGGDSGLDYYKLIAGTAKDYLKDKGVLVFEIGDDQAEDVSVLLEQNGYTGIKIYQDLCGKDRCIVGCRF